jgi:streptogramin lyase
MNQRTIKAFVVAALVGAVACIASVPIATAGPPDRLSGLHGTLWIANRGANSIGGFDATTGQAVALVPMAAGSQPGDLAFANGRLYVAEEMGTAPALAIVDPAGIAAIHRIPMPLGSRPHHVHASPDGDLVAFGLYGTDKVAVVDTATESLLGMWDTDPAIGATSGRAHAAVFSKDGSTLRGQRLDW